MNPYLVFILCVILLGYLLELVVSLLNLGSLKADLPGEFSDVYDQEEYARSQEYTRVTTRFSLVHETIMTPLIVFFILVGGFNWIDQLARSFTLAPIPTGLIFTGLLLLFTGAVGLPFSIYSTFVIEERFGFNRTTPKTFVLDIVKSLVLGGLIGGPLLAFVLWFFQVGGAYAWLYCWAAVVVFVFTMQFLAPVVIMPLFNKFTPLADGELKESITRYADRQQFAMKGIYTMDGSKRSTRLNAFFTGFGRFRRIVFFDTLMEKLGTGEIVAVLAHEMGHFKLKHIFRMMGASIVQMGIMFFILSLFLHNRGLFDAFAMEHLSIYASLVFFGFLYSPISTLMSIVFNIFSRRHEYQADRYAVQTIGRRRDLISGLKKLSVTNLSNLSPHPLNVFLNYSHPPILQRIEAIRKVEVENGC
ncbi:MAG: M48 family metalloprotease [Desulfobulbaceae bacterium]|nr:M48 family metalloprotease [Desulfobulbaceae bacterium]